MRDFFRPARFGGGGSGTKLSLLAQNAPKRGISGVPGEFCTGWACEGRVPGEFCTGWACEGCVPGEFCTGWVAGGSSPVACWAYTGPGSEGVSRSYIEGSHRHLYLGRVPPLDQGHASRWRCPVDPRSRPHDRLSAAFQAFVRNGSQPLHLGALICQRPLDVRVRHAEERRQRV